MAPLDWLIGLRTLYLSTSARAILAISLFISLLYPGSAWGQGQAGDDYEDCVEQLGEVAEVWETISEAYQNNQRLDADSLSFVASTARRARECFGETNAARRIWLLHRESWSLDELRQYREAAALVELFYDSLVLDASNLYKARFAFRRIRYRSFSGDFDAVEEALKQAREVISVLSYSEQLHVDLTEASLNSDHGQPWSAIRLAGDVLEKAAHAAEEGTPGMDFVQTRARYIQAEARMTIARSGGEGQPWIRIARDLEAVAASYRKLAMPGRYSVALADLAEVYAALGDGPRAQTRITEALAVARREADPKAELYALWRRGRLRAVQGGYRQAGRDFERALALADSSGIDKYTFDLLFDRARLDERRKALARARDRYEAITQREVSFAEGAIRAVALKAEAGERVREVEYLLIARERTVLRIGLVIALLIAVVAVAGAIVSRRSQLFEADLMERLAGNATLPFMREIATNPKGASRVISKVDKHLARRLSRGRLRGMMELYECVALLSNRIAGTDLNAHSARMRLQRLFKRNGWDWPKGEDPIEAWRRHFEAHTVE